VHAVHDHVIARLVQAHHALRVALVLLIELLHTLKLSQRPAQILNSLIQSRGVDKRNGPNARDRHCTTVSTQGRREPTTDPNEAQHKQEYTVYLLVFCVRNAIVLAVDLQLLEGRDGDDLTCRYTLDVFTVVH